MGEIRTKVMLVNTIDEAMARRGRLETADIRSYEADALVDTGAVRTVLPIHVLQRLGLQTRGEEIAEYADGRKDVVGVSEPVGVEIMGRRT